MATTRSWASVAAANATAPAKGAPPAKRTGAATAATAATTTATAAAAAAAVPPTGPYLPVTINNTLVTLYVSDFPRGRLTEMQDPERPRGDFRLVMRGFVGQVSASVELHVHTISDVGGGMSLNGVLDRSNVPDHVLTQIKQLPEYARLVEALPKSAADEAKEWRPAAAAAPAKTAPAKRPT